MAMGLANNRIQVSVSAVTVRACARPAPAQPAPDAARYPYTGTENQQLTCLEQSVCGASSSRGARNRSGSSASVIGSHARRPALAQATGSINTLDVREPDSRLSHLREQGGRG